MEPYEIYGNWPDLSFQKIAMIRFSSKTCSRGAAIIGILPLFTFQTVSGSENSSSTHSNDQTKSPARMNCGAQIECVTPDGRPGQVSRLPAPDPGATALIMDDDTVTCLLQEGETNFVIELPQTTLLDRFTFLNENAAARGELRIAVSNHRLPTNSPEWTEVEGIIPFAHKRLFGVSLLGIEAKFVRLSFHVEKESRVATLGTYSERISNALADRDLGAVQPCKRFQASGLQDALNSKFATLHARASTILLTSNSPSVAPLPPAPVE
jgi:hypothetical protein